MKKLEPHILFRNLLIEIIIYSILIFGFYLVLVRWLDGWLMSIFQTNLIYYSFAGLGLIIIQAAFLDTVTSFLMRYIKMDQFGIRRFLDVFSNR